MVTTYTRRNKKNRLQENINYNVRSTASGMNSWRRSLQWFTGTLKWIISIHWIFVKYSPIWRKCLKQCIQAKVTV